MRDTREDKEEHVRFLDEIPLLLVEELVSTEKDEGVEGKEDCEDDFLKCADVFAEDPEQKYNHDVLHKNDQALSVDAEGNLGLDWVAAGMKKHEGLCVEENLWDALNRLSLQDLENLWNLENGWSSDDAIANTFADGKLDAVNISEVMLSKECLEALLREYEPFQVLRCSFLSSCDSSLCILEEQC